MFFWTLFLILMIIPLGHTEAKITVNGGNIVQRPSFSPAYTVPLALKDDTPFVSEEIERLPSVFLKESGEGGLSLRGLSPRFTLVFLDDIPLNDMAVGQVNFSKFLTGSIQPKAVLPGANSVLYGEGAVGGVVLLETPFNEKSNKYVHGEVGSFETVYGHGSFQDKKPHHRFIIHGEGIRSSGISQYGNTRMLGEKNKYGRWGSAVAFQKGTISQNIKLTARLLESTQKYDDISLPPSSKPQDTEDFSMILLGARGKTHTHNFSQKVNIFLNETNFQNSNVSYKSSSKTTLLGGKYQGALLWSQKGTLNFLGEVRQNFLKQEDGFHKTGTDVGAGLQQIYNFTRNWRGEAGGRLNHHHRFGSHGTYSMAGAYTHHQTTLKTSLRTGFAPPSFRQLYIRNSYVQNNPSLKPETAQTLEIGLSQKLLNNKASFEILHFWTRAHNMISTSQVAGKYFPTNSSKTGHLSGVETLLSAALLERGAIYANYTYTQLSSQDTGVNVGFPKHKGALGITWDFKEKWSLNNQILYVGKRKDAYANQFLNSYFSAKLSLNYAPSSTTKFYIRIENLLNENYKQIYGYRSAKRTFYVGSSFYF